jgi:DNA-binding PadR family transcriptional regulator
MSKTDRLNLSLFETRLLWIVSKKPVHGYAILKELNAKGKKITNGTLYPALQKLLSEGFVKVEKKGAREMKVYRLSAKGMKALNNAGREFCAMFSEIFSNFVCKTCGATSKKVNH